MQPKTLFEKIWDAHVVHAEKEQPSLLYVDLHLVHEVTSAQAFEGLRMSERTVRRPELTVATVDHNIPTTDRSLPVSDELSRQQIEALDRNCTEFGVKFYDMHSEHQGIVHVISPELGYTRPGMVIVCGDSHTSTHGAMGALAMPIGTSQVEHVLATQCLVQAKPKVMEIRVEGGLPPGVTAKDMILSIIGHIGVDGATGHVVEFTGKAIRDLSMEGRMTVCNMSIEAGARVGMVAPDDTTFEYLKDRPYAPQEAAWDSAVAYWQTLPTDPGAVFDKSLVIDAAELEPYVTWGTNPGMVVPISGSVPDPATFTAASDRSAAEQALTYMGLEAGTPIRDIQIDRVFIGSCTNARIEDLRAAAQIVRGRKVNERVQAMVVPGSTQIKHDAEREGLDRIFVEAGLEWREAGCSMCLGMNPDILQPGER